MKNRVKEGLQKKWYGISNGSEDFSDIIKTASKMHIEYSSAHYMDFNLMFVMCTEEELKELMSELGEEYGYGEANDFHLKLIEREKRMFELLTSPHNKNRMLEKGGTNKMNEHINKSKDELLKIFVTEEDEKGVNLLEMTNFFDLIISKEKKVFNRANTWDASVDLNGIIGGIANAIKCGYDIKNMNLLIVDTSHFSQEIVDKLKKGIYHIGKSKEVHGNYRPAIFDDKERLVKVITLKKAINPTNVLNDISNYSMQVSLREISDQLRALRADMKYLIEMNRNTNLNNLFIYARDQVKKACYIEDEERLECLKKADEYLSEGLVNVESDIDIQIRRLSNSKNITLEEVDNCIGYFTEDMQMLFSFIGLRYYLLEYRKEYELAEEVLKDYKFFLSKLNAVTDNSKYSAFEIVHHYFPYKKNNVDFWLKEPQKIIDCLEMNKSLSEKRPKQVVYIDYKDEEDYNGE